MKDAIARKLEQVPPGFLLVGIDPHMKKHAVVVLTPEAKAVAKFMIDNCMDGFEQLRHQIEREVHLQGAKGAMYAIEAGSHYWRNLAYYLKYQNDPFRLVSPYTLKRSRDGDDLNLRKNDFRDAAMAAELLRTGKFTDAELLQGQYAELRAAYKAHHRLTQQRNRLVNLLKGLLDGLFPEFRRIFPQVHTNTALAVLSVCPVPKQIAAMSLGDFMERVGQLDPELRLQRKKLESLYVASRRSVGVGAGATAVATEIRNIVDQVRLLQAQASRWREHLTDLVATFPESPFLLSIPGLGPITVAALLGELGPMARYKSAKQLIKMAGTNPTESRSAGRSSTHTPISKKGRATLRRCLWLASIQCMHHNPEFAAWANARKRRAPDGNPLKPGEIIIAVANRLLRVAYALVKQQTAYRPAAYSAGSSPLL